MLFWKKKKEKTFEKKMEELESTVLSENDYKDAKKVEQYVVERLEQMIEVAKELEDEKDEYRMVTAYLNDIQTLEDMPDEERGKITEIATNVVQLNTARTEFLNSAKKLSDAQFAQLEQLEDEMPDTIRRFTANETHRDVLNRDMKYLEREKSEWMLRKEYLENQRKRFKNLLYVLIGLAGTLAVLFTILQIVLEIDFYYAWMGLLFIATAAICVVCLKIQNDGTEIVVAERNRNRAIVLQNKVKIKYINVANAVDYACEKYHVRSASELSQQWDYYMEAVREREKYQHTNDDLEYFNERLIRELSQYQLYDTKVWLTQAVALVDAKEMVEVKHDLINRRQKLRSRIEYNVGIMMEQKKEAEGMLDKVGDMKPQVQKILIAAEQLMEK